MSYAGRIKGRNKPQITVVISNETKKKSNASIAMATGERYYAKNQNIPLLDLSQGLTSEGYSINKGACY